MALASADICFFLPHGNLHLNFKLPKVTRHFKNVHEAKKAQSLENEIVTSIQTHLETPSEDIEEIEAIFETGNGMKNENDLDAEKGFEIKDVSDIKKEPGLTENLNACTWILENGEKCGKNYATYSSLYRHVTFFHKNVGQNCRFCERKFIDKRSLIKHEAKHKNDSISNEPPISDQTLRVFNLVTDTNLENDSNRTKKTDDNQTFMKNRSGNKNSNLEIKTISRKEAEESVKTLKFGTKEFGKDQTFMKKHDQSYKSGTNPKLENKTNSREIEKSSVKTMSFSQTMKMMFLIKKFKIKECSVSLKKMPIIAISTG